MSPIKLIPLIAIAIYLTACAAPTKQAKTALDISTPTTNGFEDFIFIQLNHNDQIHFEINEQSPSFEFDEGKSFYYALTLPEYNEPYSIKLESMFIGGRLDMAHFYYPILTVLNSDFRIVKKHNSNELTFKRYLISERPYSSINLMIDDPAYKYILIHTPYNYHGQYFNYQKSTSKMVPMSTGNAMIFIPYSSDRSFEIAYGASGEFKLITQGVLK